MKSLLRTVEQVFRQDNERFICVVAALPEWEHYDAKECPAPIRAWLRETYPDVVIEELSADYDYSAAWSCDDCDLSNGLQFPAPIFRIGFNRQQAEHFQQAWRTVPLGSPDIPKDFYFVTHELQESPVSNEVPDFDGALIPPIDLALCGKVTE